jgi:hypothetical protein
MQSLDSALLDLVRARVIAGDVAVRLANAPDTLRQQIGQLPED